MSNPVEDMLIKFSSLSSGTQKLYFESKLEALKQVTQTSLSEVLDEFSLDKLRILGHFKKKECYSNALHAAQILDALGIEDVKYVEGFILTCGIPIEHAFNKIGDSYVDVTLEQVLEVKELEDHFVYGEWDYLSALELMSHRGFYGGCFEVEFNMKINKENEK